MEHDEVAMDTAVNRPLPASLNDKPSETDQDFTQKAREAGWSEPTAFDYHRYLEPETGKVEYHANSAVYEWKDEYGDVAPELPILEEQLYGGEFKMRSGQHLENLVFEVSIEGPQKITFVAEFVDAALHPVMLDNIRKCGYSHPTTIQKYTIPAVLGGSDVVAISQTGSGKTAAYMIPVISKLMGKAKKLSAPKPDAESYNARAHWIRAEPLVVVVVPTRELAMQIFDEARRMCYRSMLRPCVVYGGLPTRMVYEDLGKGCDVLIATPGRLCDLMDQPDRLTMGRVKFTVIDEADELLDNDWDEELRKIMGGGDNNDDADHVFMMFSATFPKQARELARQYMAPDYVRIRVGRAGSSHKNISQDIIEVTHQNKRDAVFALLMSEKPTRTLIFCNSKKQVDLLDDFLYNRGLPTTSIHGERNQREREDAIRNFRSGTTPILIATGVSARGWDVAGVNHVINYDLPSVMYGGIQEYIHRIGRTGRIGHQGKATSFYNEGNDEIAQDLVNVLVECNSPVPEFLVHLTPEDGQICFDDDSDDEGADGEGEHTNGGGGVDVNLDTPETREAFVPEEAGNAAAEAAW